MCIRDRLYHCGESLSGINGELRPGIVHRIDRDTSGLIIAAKNDFAHLALAGQLQDLSLIHIYWLITPYSASYFLTYSRRTCRIRPFMDLASASAR